MIQRNIQSAIQAALADTPVILLHGARQTGKSTLMRELAGNTPGMRYVTLDDNTVLSAVASDPAGFIDGLQGPVVLDEIQRAPDLLVAIKSQVDRNRQPGRFLLTGSADIMMLPTVSESLAGRMEIITLWPFSQGEINGVRETFIDRAFAGQASWPTAQPCAMQDLIGMMVGGGYPEAYMRKDQSRRRAWFSSYVTAILQRDVRDLAQIDHMAEMPRLLAILAMRTATLLNYSDLSRSLSMPQTTLKRYMALLEATFLVQLLPAWSVNLSKRLAKSPKAMLCDTGLAIHLLGADPARLTQDRELAGQLLESFVAVELRKQASWSATQPSLYHFRALTGQEVDLILESPGGGIVAIEVKAAASASSHDFKQLRFLQQELGERFKCGIVLYTGREAVSFGPALHALPISTLWQAV